MKKKIIGAIAILTVAIAVAINLNYNSDNDLSPVTLANLEALAGGPVGTLGEFLEGEGKSCWDAIKVHEATQVFYCGTCSWIENSTDSFWSILWRCK